MLRCCGVEIAGRKANIAVVDAKIEGIVWVKLGTKRIELDDPSNQEAARSFFVTFDAFCRANEVEFVMIKGRLAKGKFAGGGVGHKIEGILQLLNVPVEVVMPTTLAAFLKKNPCAQPAGILAYQAEAYCVAWHAAKTRAP